MLDYENRDKDEVPPLADFEDYALFVRREMPTLVRRELEKMFNDEVRDIEERLRPRVAQIVLGLQLRLLQLYKQSSADSQPSEASDTSPLMTSSAETSSTPTTSLSDPQSGPTLDLSYPNFNWADWQPHSSTGPSSSTAGTEADFNWDHEVNFLFDQSFFSDVPVYPDEITTQTS